jgi:hypothetical protein
MYGRRRLALALSLAACGGGGRGQPPVRTDAATPAIVDAGTPASARPAADGGGPHAPAGAGGRAAATGAGGHAAGAGGQTSGTRATDAGALDAGQTACDPCTAYAAPKQTGTVGASELDALSGLATSRAQPELFFAHNDHDRPVVYALDQQGQLHARITLGGATASDIEDIAVGPCGTQTCVYLGDIGDNNAQRSEYAILRFVQPTVPSTPGSTAISTDYERFRFTYSDGSHNAESLMVAPDGTLYIITKLAPGSGGNVKASGPSSVYRLRANALNASVAATAEKVATLSVPKSGEGAASAAAAHACGLGFLLRTYDRVYEYRIAAGQAFESAFGVEPAVVNMPVEPQSEGIDYLADGRGFVTSGEGSKAPIMLSACGM